MKNDFKENSFSQAGEILDFLFDDIPKKDNLKAKEDFLNSWPEICGKKLSKYTRAVNITDEGVLTVKCTNSAAANELMLKKSLIFEMLGQKAADYKIRFTKIVRVYG